MLAFKDSDGKSANQRKRTKKIFFGAAAATFVIALGSTLAANINLNNNGPVEFGQGVLQTISCTTGSTVDVTLTPESVFVNEPASSGEGWVPAGGDFMVKNVRITHIPDACLGKVFTFKFYASSDAAPQSVSGGLLYTNPFGRTEESVTLGEALSSDLMRPDGSGGFISDGLNYEATYSQDDNALNINMIRTYSILAKSVVRITIETSDPTIPYSPMFRGFGLSDGGGSFSFRCSSGSFITGIHTDPTTGDGWNPYLSADCSEVGIGNVLGNPTTTQIFNGYDNYWGTIASTCATGKAALGVSVVSSSYVAELRPICGDFPGGTNLQTFNDMMDAETGRFICPAHQFIVGFTGRSGAGNDHLEITCSRV